MDSTRSTVEMLTADELRDCYEAYATGTEIGRLAARYGVYPAELQAAMDRISRERKARAESPRANTIGKLNDFLFEELGKLNAIDPHDKDALKAEVERSKAIEGIAKAVIDNANTVLDATRMRAQYTQASVELPRMLEG